MSSTPANCLTSEAVECACESCHCLIRPGQGVRRDGRHFCSATCAYDCTRTTCLCVHKGCGESTAGDTK
jgi:hypothetical protein